MIDGATKPVKNNNNDIWVGSPQLCYLFTLNVNTRFQKIDESFTKTKLTVIYFVLTPLNLMISMCDISDRKGLFRRRRKTEKDWEWEKLWFENFVVD